MRGLGCDKQLPRPGSIHRQLGNLIHCSSTKSKSVLRSVLASEIYGMVGVDMAIAINTMIKMITEQLGFSHPDPWYVPEGHIVIMYHGTTVSVEDSRFALSFGFVLAVLILYYFYFPKEALSPLLWQSHHLPLRKRIVDMETMRALQTRRVWVELGLFDLSEAHLVRWNLNTNWLQAVPIHTHYMSIWSSSVNPTNAEKLRKSDEGNTQFAGSRLRTRASVAKGWAMIDGKDNPADAMTKSAPNRALENFLTTNCLQVRVEG